MSIWENNKEILLKHYPGLLEELTSSGGYILEQDDIKIETSSTGELSLCVKDIHVHSMRDPVREGQRLAEAAAGGYSPAVILGFGLGYAAQAVAFSGRPVIIVEKYKNLLVKALEHRDFTGFLSKNRIIFIIGGTGDGITNALAIASEILPAKKTDDKSEPAVIRNKALVELDKEWYGEVENRIRTWSMKGDVNTATLKRFGRRWIRNLSRNMNAIRDYPGINFFSALAKTNIPVFLAAAGPSLDKIKPYLQDIYRRCIIVAVDTNLRFFANNDIAPDFVVTVDPQFWNSRHLDRCVSENTILIAESAVYPPVLNLPFKRKYLCSSLFPFGIFIEKRTCPKGVLGAGGSVATAAWDFARSLGGQDIWIAGLDLAFPGLKTHFRGARFEENALSHTCRFNPVEKWIMCALRGGIPFNARCAAGGQVLTDRRLSLYAAWFENRFAVHRQLRNFALFQEGLLITGLQFGETKTLLALPDIRGEIDRRLKVVFSQTDIEFFASDETQKRSQRYDNAVSALKRGLEDIREIAKEGITVTKQALYRSLNPAQQNKTLKDLDEITRRITESKVKEVAGFLFPPVEKSEDTALADEDQFRTYLKTSQFFFISLTEAVSFNLECMK